MTTTSTRGGCSGCTATRLDTGARRRRVRTTAPRCAPTGWSWPPALGRRSWRGPERLAGVHVLRTIDDALALREDLRPGARLVVIGAGFIGSRSSLDCSEIGS